MTSQSIEDKIKIFSTTGINNNNNNNTVKSRQRVLMKENNINQIKNNNILFLNRTVIESECNAKTSNLLQFTPSTIELTKFLQPSREKYLDSDAEVIEDYDNEKPNDQKCKNSEASNLKNYDFVKKETPLLQIFDGNVVISQELSLEEVQNLLFQINSKLQTQTSVNSEDFPNTTFSNEENSDVEIIVETGKESEIGNGDNRSISPGDTGIRKKSGKWNSGPGVASNNRNLLLKPLSVVEKIGKSLNRASTSSETNFLISFKAFDDGKLGRHGFEHDYSVISRAGPDENESQNAPDGDVAAEQLMVEKADPDAELMQIEVIESSGGQTASSVSTANIHTNKDGDPIKLPDNLESVPKAENFPTQRHRWNTNEEIAAILISFDKHNEWQSKEVIIRPKSGSMLLYSRKKVRYRRDGYCWKKRKDGKTTREDHMKLKVQGTECIYGCYVHSAILPTFHRRCYWLLQNPDIVLVHYLNVPYPDDNKLAVLAPSLALWGDKKEWTKEELISQLKPMFYSEQERDMNNELEISTAETVEVIVAQLMEKQRVARAASLSKQLECGCPDSTCADSKTCSHPMRRITAANIKQEPNSRIGIGHGDNNNQVTSTTGSRILLNKMNSGSNSTTVHQKGSRSERANHGPQPHSSSLVLSLSQIHSGPGLSLSQIQDGPNVLILNNPSANGNSGQPSAPVAMVTNYKCSTASGQSMSTQHHHPPLKQYHHPRNKIILKHETGDPGQLSCCRMTTQDSKMTESSTSSSRLNQLINGVFSDGKVEAERGSNQVPVSPSRSMDTCENSSDTILILNTSSGNRVNSLSSVVPGSSFYNETLDLSQEDIQRTLSANLPLANFPSHRENSQSKSPSPCNTMVSTDVMVPEINPMELMDSPPAVVDDDVFVNLDAFDMLSDFPELEVLDSANNTGPTSAPVASGEADVNNDKTRNCDGLGGGRGKTDSDQETNATIVKDESSTSNVHADFRETCASITDFSPEWAYPEGGVKVLVTGPWYSSRSRYTVLFDSFPVPTTLVQSGVLRCFCPAHEVGLATVQVASDGFVISNSVMFEYKRPPHDDLINLKEPKVEDNENLLKFTLLQRLEAVDGRLHIKEEPEGADVSDAFGLYHQSVDFEERMVNFCQNMTNRKWRVAQEFSTTWTSGLRGMTLLHLAASLGYARLVCTLLHWRSENSSLLLDMEIDALRQDDEGFTPLMRACGRGHRETALVLYRWNHTALNVYNLKHQTALTYARAKGQTALANELEKLESSREQANVTLLSNTSNTFDRISETDVITPCESPTSSTISLNSSKSHDGIFLRPDPVVKSESRFKTFSVEHGSSFSDRSKTPSPTSGLTDTYEAHRLIKRPSVDSGINLGSYQSECFPGFRSATKFKMGSNGETPKLTSLTQSLSSPAVGDLNREADGRRMDFALCEVTAVEASSKSSPNTVENVVEDDADNVGNNVGEEDVRVLTLAEQIIAAIPERIKNESEEMQLDDCSPNETSFSSETLSDALMDPFLNDPPSSYHPSEFNFEFSDNNYRYYDVGTPSSSLSPGSSSLQSPSSSFPIDSPSPPPTTQDFCEFFQASGFPFEKDFSNLTLSDREQRELYKAAKIIQKAYRSYKGRKKLAEDKERAAAILIQNYYRRYKQYAYFKQMTHAAMVIQNGYRSYCEHKRFKKSQEAALCIQNYYRHYKEQGESKRGSRESTPSNGLKRTYSQRRQHQAACKIQQFMRQSKIKLQKERTLAAERGRLDVRQSSQDVRRRSPSRDNSVPNDRFAEDDVEDADA